MEVSLIDTVENAVTNGSIADIFDFLDVVHDLRFHLVC